MLLLVLSIKNEMLKNNYEQSDYKYRKETKGS